MNNNELMEFKESVFIRQIEEMEELEASNIHEQNKKCNAIMELVRLLEKSIRKEQFESDFEYYDDEY